MDDHNIPVLVDRTPRAYIMCGVEDWSIQLKCSLASHMGVWLARLIEMLVR